MVCVYCNMFICKPVVKEKFLMEQKIIRKNRYTDDARCLTERVLDEYKLFCYEMMERDKKEIFESCNKIKFYTCVSEYFEWKEDIDKEHVEFFKKIVHPLETLWQYYLSHGYLAAATWEDIDELLSCFRSSLLMDIMPGNIQE